MLIYIIDEIALQNFLSMGQGPEISPNYCDHNPWLFQSNLHVYSNPQNTLCMYLFLIIELSDFQESVYNLIPSFLCIWLLCMTW